MPLEVTKFLTQYGFEGLETLSIGRVRHDKLPLNILNYSQIDSPKFHPVVQECRGIVVDDNFKVVGKGFNRFYNLGENPEEKCNTLEAQIQEKVDGSFILLYNYDGWRVNTRNSWADGEINGYKWADLFWRNIQGTPKENLSLVFELVSPYNQVVQLYPEGLYLLAGYMPDLTELNSEQLDELAQDLGVQRPQQYSGSLNEAKEYLAQLEKDNPRFEGFVLKDAHNQRVKIKSQTYLAIHRLKNNGNVATYRGFIPFYIQGEEAELIATFPEYADLFLSYKDRLDSLCLVAQSKLDELKGLEQKEFALAIQRLDYKSLLFTCRKSGVHIRNGLVGAERLLEKYLCSTQK